MVRLQFPSFGSLLHCKMNDSDPSTWLFLKHRSSGEPDCHPGESSAPTGRRHSGTAPSRPGSPSQHLLQFCPGFLQFAAGASSHWKHYQRHLWKRAALNATVTSVLNFTDQLPLSHSLWPGHWDVLTFQPSLPEPLTAEVRWDSPDRGKHLPVLGVKWGPRRKAAVYWDRDGVYVGSKWPTI